MEKPNTFRIFTSVKLIKTKIKTMQKLANTIVSTFLTIIGTGTLCAIGFTFYTVFTM